MHRIMLFLFAATMAFVLSVATGYASSPDRESLLERFKLSRIDGPSASADGHVTKKGTVLVLEADAIPAKELSEVLLPAAVVACVGRRAGLAGRDLGETREGERVIEVAAGDLEPTTTAVVGGDALGAGGAANH